MVSLLTLPTSCAQLKPPAARIKSTRGATHARRCLLLSSSSCTSLLLVFHFSAESEEFSGGGGGRMARATLKGKYDADKNSGSAIASVAFFSGDVKLKASVSDATVAKGPSLNGLVLSVEKPGTFIVDCDVPRKDFRFQFMNTVRVLEKPLSLTYIHFHGPNRSTLDGTLTFDPANKISSSYAFQTGNCRIKYAYSHGSMRRTVFEPTYDFSKKAWDFSILRKFDSADSVRASYETSGKNLKLEWSRDSKVNGIFKIAASVDLKEEQKIPKLTAETTWNFDIL